MTLKEKALKGVKWTAISSFAGSAAQLVQIIILTHFLSPVDFGLFAIAVIVLSFSQMFIDFGVSNAIIYKQDITKPQLDTLYWLNIFSGILVFVLLFFAAPIIANFYEEQRLTFLIRLISIIFLIQPYEQQFLILLKKELLFNQIAKRDIISKIISLITAGILAVNGFGVLALVYAHLAGVVVSTFLMIYIGLQHHRPSLYFNFNSIKGFFKFGLFQMGESLLNYFNRDFDTILIGKLLGLEAVGIYNVAKTLAMRPAQIINPIVTQISFPVMAKLQHDINQLKKVYLKTIDLLSTINFAIYAFVAFFAEPIIILFFGEKWHSAVLVLRILSLYAMVRSTGNPIGALIYARGRADLGFYWNLVLFFLIPAFVYFGSFYGVEGIAYTLLGFQLIILLPAWKLLVNKCCGAGLVEYFKVMSLPLMVAAVQSIFYLLIIFTISSLTIQLIAGSILFLVSSFYLNKIFNKEGYLLFRQLFQLKQPLPEGN